jgi:hypothetical protein
MGSYLNKGGCNTSSATVAAKVFFLRFSDNGSGVFGLGGI